MINTIVIPFSIINTLLSVSFLTVGILSSILLLRSRIQSSVFLSLSAYGATLWILAAMVFINVENPAIFSVAIKTMHIAGAAILTAVTCFAYTFLGGDIRKNRKLLYALLLLFLFFSAVLLFSETIVKKTAPAADARTISFGPFYILYAIYILGAAFISYYYLIKKYISTRDRVQKAQLIYVGIGTFTSLSIGLVINIILPFFGHFTFYWLGPFLSVVFVIFTMFAIFKHHLFNIKVIATEIFAALIPLAILVDIFAFTERALLPYKIILFFGVSIFSVFLVRGVFKEVEAKEALMRLNQAKTDFLNIASHQLRTPISVIKGVVSMMREGDWDKLPEEKKKMFFEGLWHKSNKLESIVNDILNAAEMSNEKYKIIDKKAEWIDAKELFDKVVEESQAEAAEREIELKVSLPQGALPKIYGQVEYLKEAIGNLVDNAIKYTPSTKADYDARDTRALKGVVKLGLAYDKDNAIISVRDNGIGVPQEEMSKLFAKFYRAQNARNMYTDGSGLGLFIVKEIAEGHGGRVWGKSEVGKGATFFISLPLNPPKEADVRKHILEGEAVANSR